MSYRTFVGFMGWACLHGCRGKVRGANAAHATDIPARSPVPGEGLRQARIMVPMRDGVKLHTVHRHSEGAQGAPVHSDPHAL